MSRIRISLTLALTVLILNPSSAFLTRTYAFGPTCQYSSVDYNYPNEVNPNQQFMVSIAMPTVCPQANNYHVMARFDVENSMSRVLASNYTQYGFVPNNGKPFTFIVTNQLTAPSKPERWQLQFIVYAFISEDDADGLDYKVTAPETIQVGQPMPVQTSNNTVTSTTPESSTLSTTTFPTITQSTAEALGPATNSNDELYQITATAIAILLIFTLILLMRRKSHSETQA